MGGLLDLNDRRRLGRLLAPEHEITAAGQRKQHHDHDADDEPPPAAFFFVLLLVLLDLLYRRRLRTRRHRLGRGRGLSLDDIDDDDGGVVLARFVCLLDRPEQALDAFLGRRRPGGGLHYDAGGEGIQPVARHDQAVAGQQRVTAVGAIDLGDVVAGHRAHQHVARKPRLGLDVDALPLHAIEVPAVAVVLVFFHQVLVADQIEMTVANAHPEHRSLGEGRGHHRAAHAIERRRLLDGVAQCTVGLEQTAPQDARWLFFTELAGEALVEGRHDEVARDVAGGVTAHAVGHDHERRSLGRSRFVVDIGDEEGVFLVVPRAVDLVAGDFEEEIHELTPMIQNRCTGREK